MLNIPLDALGERRELFLEQCEYAEILDWERMRQEGSGVFSRTIRLTLPDLDLGTRKSFPNAPRRVATTIDFRTMLPAEGGQEDPDWRAGFSLSSCGLIR